MIRRPPRSTRTDTLFPYTTLFRSARQGLWTRCVSAGGLHEFQRHAVRFADRQIFFAVLVAFGERRRQRPDALRIILAVLGIGVDLAFARQLEARGLGKGADRAFLHLSSEESRVGKECLSTSSSLVTGVQTCALPI